MITDFPHGRVPRPVREEQLLALAETLFAERGYDGVSMEELARSAGVTKPVIYGLFGSKEELFSRCFERAGDELAAAMAEATAPHAGDLEATVRASALAFLHFIGHHGRAWAVLYALDSGGRTETHLQRIRAQQADFVAGTLAALNPGLDAHRGRAVAFLLNGAFEALAHWRREGAEVSDEEAAEWLVTFTVPGLKALLADA
jgi:AcrR family transcriptional regulator